MEDYLDVVTRDGQDVLEKVERNGYPTMKLFRKELLETLESFRQLSHLRGEHFRLTHINALSDVVEEWLRNVDPVLVHESSESYLREKRLKKEYEELRNQQQAQFQKDYRQSVAAATTRRQSASVDYSLSARQPHVYQHQASGSRLSRRLRGETPDLDAVDVSTLERRSRRSTETIDEETGASADGKLDVIAELGEDEEEEKEEAAAAMQEEDGSTQDAMDEDVAGVNVVEQDLGADADISEGNSPVDADAPHAVASEADATLERAPSTEALEMATAVIEEVLGAAASASASASRNSTPAEQDGEVTAEQDAVAAAAEAGNGIPVAIQDQADNDEQAMAVDDDVDAGQGGDDEAAPLDADAMAVEQEDTQLVDATPKTYSTDPLAIPTHLLHRPSSAQLQALSEQLAVATAGCTVDRLELLRTDILRAVYVWRRAVVQVVTVLIEGEGEVVRVPDLLNVGEW